MTSLSSDSDLSIPVLPAIPVDHISGFLEALLDRGGEERVSTLARRLFLTIDEMLPILEAGKLLGFVQVSQADIAITDVGRLFAEATICQRRRLFREQALENVPMLSFITRMLFQSGHTGQNADAILEKFQHNLPVVDVRKAFATAVEWGRYADLFEYDARTKRLHLLTAKA